MKKILSILFLSLFLFCGISEGAELRTLLDRVVTTGESSAVGIKNSTKYTFHITASGVSSGGVVKIQTSLNGDAWADLSTNTISTNGTTEVAVSGLQHNYVRANVTSRSDGTYTVQMLTN